MAHGLLRTVSLSVLRFDMNVLVSALICWLARGLSAPVAVPMQSHQNRPIELSISLICPGPHVVGRSGTAQITESSLSKTDYHLSADCSHRPCPLQQLTPYILRFEIPRYITPDITLGSTALSFFDSLNLTTQILVLPAPTVDRHRSLCCHGRSIQAQHTPIHDAMTFMPELLTRASTLLYYMLLCLLLTNHKPCCHSGAVLCSILISTCARLYTLVACPTKHLTTRKQRSRSLYITSSSPLLVLIRLTRWRRNTAPRRKISQSQRRLRLRVVICSKLRGISHFTSTWVCCITDFAYYCLCRPEHLLLVLFFMW